GPARETPGLNGAAAATVGQSSSWPAISDSAFVPKQDVMSVPASTRLQMSSPSTPPVVPGSSLPSVPGLRPVNARYRKRSSGLVWTQPALELAPIASLPGKILPAAAPSSNTCVHLGRLAVMSGV